MAHAKPISKEDVLRAMKQTRSVKAASRYLNCSYQHLKPFMKAYKDDETGISLFDMHKNQCGKGIPKFMSNSPFGKKHPAIEDVVNGTADASSFTPDKLKFKMVEAGYMIEQCYWCGFSEKREIDGKIPLIMFFKDTNKHNYQDGNCQLSCYNCYFIRLGNVFTERDMESLEGHQTVYKTTDAIDFKLDDFHMKQLDELGLRDKRVEDDPYSLVSRKG
jgi:hypothetical protein